MLPVEVVAVLAVMVPPHLRQLATLQLQPQLVAVAVAVAVAPAKVAVAVAQPADQHRRQQ
jgi:hypothetical protein